MGTGWSWEHAAAHVTPHKTPRRVLTRNERASEVSECVCAEWERGGGGVEGAGACQESPRGGGGGILLAPLPRRGDVRLGGGRRSGHPFWREAAGRGRSRGRSIHRWLGRVSGARSSPLLSVGRSNDLGGGGGPVGLHECDASDSKFGADPLLASASSGFSYLRKGRSLFDPGRGGAEVHPGPPLLPGAVEEGRKHRRVVS